MKSTAANTTYTASDPHALPHSTTNQQFVGSLYTCLALVVLRQCRSAHCVDSKNLIGTLWLRLARGTRGQQFRLYQLD